MTVDLKMLFPALSNFDCCQLLNAQEENFENTMAAILPSIQSPHFATFQERPYGMAPAQINNAFMNINPRIVNCDFGDNPKMEPLLCTGLSNVMTNKGLAYGLNVSFTLKV